MHRSHFAGTFAITVQPAYYSLSFNERHFRWIDKDLNQLWGVPARSLRKLHLQILMKNFVSFKNNYAIGAAESFFFLHLAAAAVCSHRRRQNSRISQSVDFPSFFSFLRITTSEKKQMWMNSDTFRTTRLLHSDLSLHHFDVATPKYRIILFKFLSILEWKIEHAIYRLTYLSLG